MSALMTFVMTTTMINMIMTLMKKGDRLDETKMISHQLAIGFVTKPHLSSLEGLSVSVRLFVCLCLSMSVGVCVFEGEKITKS